MVGLPFTCINFVRNPTLSRTCFDGWQQVALEFPCFVFFIHSFVTFSFSDGSKFQHKVEENYFFTTVKVDDDVSIEVHNR